MLSLLLKFIRIFLLALIAGSYVMVLLSLTVVDSFYYGDFIFAGSILILSFFMVEGIAYLRKYKQLRLEGTTQGRTPRQ